MTDNQSKLAREERRRFFLTSVAGSTLALFSLGNGHAEQAGGDTSTTVRVVNDFCAAVSKRDPGCHAAILR
jgi:hypothetical protein